MQACISMIKGNQIESCLKANKNTENDTAIEFNSYIFRITKH